MSLFQKVSFAIVCIVLLALGLAMIKLSFQAYTGKVYNDKEDFQNELGDGLIRVGGFIGYLLLLMVLFYHVLFFIPENWGYINPDGEFRNARMALALIMSLVGCSTLFYYSRHVLLLLFKLFPRKKLKPLLEALNLVEIALDNKAFSKVRRHLELYIFINQEHPSFEDMANDQWDEHTIYYFIVTQTEDFIGSADGWISKGVYRPLSEVEDLLNIFDNSIDALVAVHRIGHNEANHKKTLIRLKFKSLG